MGRHLRASNGRFAGSVGDGKTRLPTPSDTAVITDGEASPDQAFAAGVAGYLAMHDGLRAEQADPAPVASPRRWHVPYLGRPCSICGKRLEYAGSHSASDCDHTAIRHDDHDRRDLRARLADRLTGGEAARWTALADAEHAAHVYDNALGEPGSPFDPGIRAIPTGRSRLLTDEETTDVWATGDPGVRAAIVGAHIADHPDGLFTPSQALRASIVEYPAGSQAPILLARLDPPLDDAEKTRMLGRAGNDTRIARALLADPDSRDLMRRHLTTTPSKAGISLAHSGRIPTDILTGMAQSGNVRLRVLAAGAPNTADTDVAVLARDSSAEVRRAVATRAPGTLPRATVEALLADEHPDIAFHAFMHNAHETGAPTETGGYRVTRAVTPAMVEMFAAAPAPRQAELRDRLRRAPLVDLDNDPLAADLLA